MDPDLTLKELLIAMRHCVVWLSSRHLSSKETSISTHLQKTASLLLQTRSRISHIWWLQFQCSGNPAQNLCGAQGDSEATPASPGPPCPAQPFLMHRKQIHHHYPKSWSSLFKCIFKFPAHACFLLFHQRLGFLFGDIICQHMQFVTEKWMIKE